MSVPILVKIDQEMRPWECSQTDRHTDRQTDRHTDANRFYNLSHAICYCYGTDKKAILRFWAPLGGLEATYDDHLRLIGKCVVDFLLVLVELVSLGVTAEALYTSEYLFKIGDFAPTGPGWPKILGRMGRPSTNYSSSQKTRLSDHLYPIKYGQIFLPFCHNPRVWQTDRQTDGRTDRWTEFSLLDRVCIPCSGVKINYSWGWSL